MPLVYEDMLTEAAQRGIPIHYQTLAIPEIQRRWDSGTAPLVLGSGGVKQVRLFPPPMS